MGFRTSTGRGVDGIIQPVAPYVAGHQNDFQYYSYSALANVLDVPAAVFTVCTGFFQAELASEEALGSVLPLSEADEQVQKNCK